MIIGIGFDLIEIDRIEGVMKKNPRFLSEFFSEGEQAYFADRQFSPSVVAANFAGKEAFSKALGTGVRGFSLREVAVLRDGLGCPYLVLFGNAKQAAEARGIHHFHVSLTHTRTCAGAVVIGETLSVSEERGI